MERGERPIFETLYGFEKDDFAVYGEMERLGIQRCGDVLVTRDIDC